MNATLNLWVPLAMDLLMDIAFNGKSRGIKEQFALFVIKMHPFILFTLKINSEIKYGFRCNAMFYVICIIYTELSFDR